jgi:hypothetical protein
MIHELVVSGQWSVVSRNQFFTDHWPLTTDHCFSPFDSECCVLAGRLDADLFDMLDASKLRACRDVVLEAFDAFGCSFGEDFDATVCEVSHVAYDLMTRCDALCEEAITNSLNVAAYHVVTRNSHVALIL